MGSFMDSFLFLFSLLDDDHLLCLHTTVVKGDTACMSLLLDAKADLQARTPSRGQTPLFLASQSGQVCPLQLLIDRKADVQSVDHNGISPAYVATLGGRVLCLQLLIEARADVVSPTSVGPSRTPAMAACQEDRLACLQLLVEAKADPSETSAQGAIMLYSALSYPFGWETHRVPGLPFAMLSCDTDAKRVMMIVDAVKQEIACATVTQATVMTHIDEYKHIHSFINECHNVAKHALSTDAVVDTRVGRGDNGLYPKPLKQVLLYLGLSMHKDQTVNKSIDGKNAPRALIPGHPTNANLWYELYQCTHCSSCSARLAKPKKCPCHTARDCASHYQRVEE
jgi:hypothetical protein